MSEDDTRTKLLIVEIVRQKDCAEPFDMVIRRCLGPDVTEPGGYSGIAHVHALFIFNGVYGRGRGRKQRLRAICSTTINVYSMSLLNGYQFRRPSLKYLILTSITSCLSNTSGTPHHWSLRSLYCCLRFA